MGQPLIIATLSDLCRYVRIVLILQLFLHFFPGGWPGGRATELVLIVGSNIAREGFRIGQALEAYRIARLPLGGRGCFRQCAL